MKHSIIVITIATIFVFTLCPSCIIQRPPVASNVTTDPSTDFIAAISQVWADTVNQERKVVLANINTSNMFIGTDVRYGDEGFINLEGVTKNFELNWTVMIKKKQESFPKKYIAYKGMLTDTTSDHKRMIAYSALDTLYLKALPPPVIKNQVK